LPRLKHLVKILRIAVKEDTMSKLLVSDELWNLVEPILPKHPYVPGVGKPRVPDRICLTGIIFVLKTGIPWEDFPHEMGCCGMTLWNRLDEWRQAGVWNQLHRLVLNQLRAQERIDLSRVIVDSSSVRAVHGGKKRDQAPWTAGKTGRNTTSLLMRAVYLLPRSSLEPIATT
jgi:transposase